MTGEPDDRVEPWTSLLRQLPTSFPAPDIFLAELERAVDAERAAWTPRQRRLMRLRRPWYRARFWLSENVTWRFARHMPGDGW